MGHSVREEGHVFGPHTHLGFEIVYFKSGSGDVRVVADRAPVTVEPDDVLLMAPGVEHSFIVGQTYMEYYWIGIQTDRIAGISGGHILPPFRLRATESRPVTYRETSAEYRVLEDLGRNLAIDRFAVIHNAPEFMQPLADIVEEVVTVRPYREHRVFGAIISLLAMTNRRLDAEDRAGSRSPLIRAAIEYVRAHWNEQITLESVARHLGVHASHLSRQFHASAGVPFRDYVTAVRIQHAKEHLVAGEPVGNTARACGYSSIHSFSRAFHRATGHPPSTYIARPYAS